MRQYADTPRPADYAAAALFTLITLRVAFAGAPDGAHERCLSVLLPCVLICASAKMLDVDMRHECALYAFAYAHIFSRELRRAS